VPAGLGSGQVEEYVRQRTTTTGIDEKKWSSSS
jgi:hypothetical protein